MKPCSEYKYRERQKIKTTRLADHAPELMLFILRVLHLVVVLQTSSFFSS